jgi:excisionase family DNA binding protein
MQEIFTPATAVIQETPTPNVTATDASAGPTLMTVEDVARVLRCAPRTVYRLYDAGRIPPPVKLRSLIRWPEAVIKNWIAAGCPKPEKPSTRPALKSP